MIKRPHLFTFLITALFLLPFNPLHGQRPVRYEVTLSNIKQHEIVISAEFPSLPQQPLVVRMPTSSPGRYALHQFAKNVYQEKAFDENGNPLKVVKTDLSTWEVTGHRGYVRFEYTLFANHGDGTYSGIDNRKLHLNMPATFVYTHTTERRPVELSFDLKDHPEWSVATQLQPIGRNTFRAPDYYYFYDSPTMVGDIRYRQFEVESHGKKQTIEIAAQVMDSDSLLDVYAGWVQKVVEEEKKVYGELPDYDFGRYTFLVSYNPWVFGDGMEHRNSTVCSSQGSLERNANQLIGTIAHEFFHCWNVERIRPQSLEPFDFDWANMSGELWLAEGFTSYYDDLMLRRAGLLSEEDYIQGLKGGLNYTINGPGRDFRGPVEMSYQAPFVDAATSIDEFNAVNTFISYYTYGSVIGLTLDLTLRNRFENVTLDDFMRYLWGHYGKTEIPYQLPDLQEALATVTGDAVFAADFFERYIYGHDLPDFSELFEPMGVDFGLQHPEESDMAHLMLEFRNGKAIVNGPIMKNHSLYGAGVNSGDQLLEIDGKTIDNQEAWKAIASTLKVGKTCSITYEQKGITEKGTFICRQNPMVDISLPENGGKAKEKKRRKAWLGS